MDGCFSISHKLVIIRLDTLYKPHKVQIMLPFCRVSSHLQLLNEWHLKNFLVWKRVMDVTQFKRNSCAQIPELATLTYYFLCAIHSRIIFPVVVVLIFFSNVFMMRLCMQVQFYLSYTRCIRHWKKLFWKPYCESAIHLTLDFPVICTIHCLKIAVRHNFKAVFICRLFAILFSKMKGR